MSDRLWPPSTLLGRLDDAPRNELLGLGVSQLAEATRRIVREGILESHVVVLERALTKVTVSMADGRQALLAIRVSGDIVGEISALNGTPRSATVTTCRASRIRIIHRNEFRAFLRRHPDAAMEVAGRVADKLRWANRRRVDFASYPVKTRLARVLWEIGTAYGCWKPEGLVVDIQLTQAELATMCGAAEMTVQKSLRELRAAGILSTGYRRLVIRDPAVLRDVAGIE